MKIALDVLGGDNSPHSNIDGAVDYLTEYGENAADLILVGDQNIIKSRISNSFPYFSKIKIVHTTESIDMNERSSRIFKEKPNSSIVKSINFVKNKQAHAVLSAGNTGALLSSSLFLIGKISGITRPAIAPYIPTNNGGFILCDAGANADSKPHHLVQFAIMAEAYIEHLTGKPSPRIALLNIGSEEKKGNELVKNAHPLLKQYCNNFIGNIESRYLMEGKAEVVVCDGFTGNIVLKLTEGIISHILEWMTSDIEILNIDSKNTKIFKNLIESFNQNLDHEEYGATPFLGINGIVMKCHGSSTKKAIKNSLKVAQNAIEKNLINDIIYKLEKYTEINNDKEFTNEKSPI